MKILPISLLTTIFALSFVWSASAARHQCKESNLGGSLVTFEGGGSGEDDDCDPDKDPKDGE